jgi:hypothetical protein
MVIQVQKYPGVTAMGEKNLPVRVSHWTSSDGLSMFPIIFHLTICRKDVYFPQGITAW